MSAPIAMKTIVPEEAALPFETFRQQVATYYANILYGLHLRKEPMVYTFPYTLAGVEFDSTQLQPTLCALLRTKLAVKEEEDLRLTYTRVLRATNMTPVNGEVELCLRIEATAFIR